MSVLMKIKRLAMYSTLHFNLKSALWGAPLDAARKKTTGDNPLFFHRACSLEYEVSTKPKGALPFIPATPHVTNLV